METTQKYIIDYIAKLYIVHSGQEIHILNRYCSYSAYQKKLVWSVAMMAELTFHEAQSLIFNTVVEEFEELCKRIRFGYKDSKGLLKRQPKITHLLVFLERLFGWMTVENFRNLTANLATAENSHPKETNLELIAKTTFGQQILKIFATVEANPVKFSQQVKKAWSQLVPIPKKQLEIINDISHQMVFVLDLAASQSFDVIDAFFCAMELGQIFADYDDQQGIQFDQDQKNSASYFLLESDLISYTWTFNQENWLQLFDRLNGKSQVVHLAQKMTVFSIDFVNAMIERYGLELFMENLPKFNAPKAKTHNLLEIMVRTNDLWLLIYLLELHTQNDTFEAFCERMTIALGRNLKFADGVRTEEDTNDAKRDLDYYFLMFERIRKLHQLLQKLPSIKAKVAEDGVRPLLSFDTYIPNVNPETQLLSDWS
jgi:hypothetical protein